MTCKQRRLCSLVPAEWFLFCRLPWLSSTQGLSELKQSPHSLLCTPWRVSLSIVAEANLTNASPCPLFFPCFGTYHNPIVNWSREPNQRKTDTTTKSVFFSMFSSLNQPIKGQTDANAVSRNIWSGGGVGMPVLGRSSYPYCKITAARSSWRLADHSLSFTGCRSLPPTPDVELLSRKGMASPGLWGTQSSLSTASRTCQTSSHPAGSCAVSELCTNKTDLPSAR